MPAKPRVVVVGLGPAGADLLLPAARAALERVPIRFVRTARHPAVVDLARDGIELEPLDLLYDRADDLDTVYAAIADRVVETARERARSSTPCPGSPTIAERSVELVRAAGIDVELIPGISFVDLAWWRLGIDPMHGARVVDARAFAIDAAGSSGPMLIAQCDSQLVCSEVKLALLESLPAEHEVTVLQRLGLPDERIFTVALADLDREVEPDHLTSLFVDTGEHRGRPRARAPARAHRAPARPGRLPVGRGADAPHACAATCSKRPTRSSRRSSSSRPTRPAGDIPIGAYDALEDELGDLLFQVMIQSVLASEAGAFTVADVARAVHAKLVRRHPHVFGDVQVNDASEVVTNWEQIKKTEKDDQSLVAGVTAGLPALIAAQKLFRKGASIGLEPDVDLADARPAAVRRPTPAASKRRSARRSRRWSRSVVSTTSTRSRRWRVGRVATRTGSAGWSSSRSTPASTSRARPPAQVRELWEQAGGGSVMEQLDALRASVTRLRAIVDGFDADQLRAQAYPAEWTVADVLSHLGSSAVIMQLRLDAALAGRELADDFAAADLGRVEREIARREGGRRTRRRPRVRRAGRGTRRIPTGERPHRDRTAEP